MVVLPHHGERCSLCEKEGPPKGLIRNSLQDSSLQSEKMQHAEFHLGEEGIKYIYLLG